MRIEQLKYFVEVARCGSIRKASEHLFMAQQSLSQSVKKLESELGVALFERSLSGSTLTREGEAVLSFAETVLREEERLHNRLSAIAEERSEQMLEGAVDIYAFGVYDLFALPNLLKSYQRQYPKVRIKTHTADFKIIREAVRVGNTDNFIGLIVLPDAETMDLEADLGLTNGSFFPLTKGRYLLCCSKDHPLAKKRHVSLKQAASYLIVDYTVSQFENGAVHKIIQQYGYDLPATHMETQSFNILIDMIASGQGIAFMNEYQYEGMQKSSHSKNDGIVAIPVEEPLRAVLGCVVDANHSRAVEKFVQLLLI